jgi:hypothetical protein
VFRVALGSASEAKGFQARPSFQQIAWYAAPDEPAWNSEFWSHEARAMTYEVKLLCEDVFEDEDVIDELIRFMITHPGIYIKRVEGLSDEELRARKDVVFQSMMSS